LTQPESREAYRYVEIAPFSFFGLRWQPGLGRFLSEQMWDVVCVSANLRHLSRIWLFLRNSKYRRRWIWWGLIFGEIRSKVLSKIRIFLFERAAGCLVHSKAVSFRLEEKCGIKAISFNNTEIKRDEFRTVHFNKAHREIRMLFVGTYKPRKKLERLIQLSIRRDDIRIRIVGPGMKSCFLTELSNASKRVEIFDRATGSDLNRHFDWADLTVSPGNVGLLIMNSARHGKGIVIDNDSYHGPEYWLAKETGQPFISFCDSEEVDQFINYIKENRLLLQQWGDALQVKAKEEYTIEHMVEVHIRVFKAVSTGQWITT